MSPRFGGLPIQTCNLARQIKLLRLLNLSLIEAVPFLHDEFDNFRQSNIMKERWTRMVQEWIITFSIGNLCRSLIKWPRYRFCSLQLLQCCYILYDVNLYSSMWSPIYSCGHTGKCFIPAALCILDGNCICSMR